MQSRAPTPARRARVDGRPARRRGPRGGRRGAPANRAAPLGGWRSRHAGPCPAPGEAGVLRRLLGGRMAPAPPPPPQPQAPAPPPRQPQAPAPAPAAPAPVAVPGVEAAVLAAAADGIVATDPGGQIVLTNRAAQSQTGFGDRELVGNSLHGLLHPACEDPHCPVIATQRDGRPRTFVTETMRRRDGSQVAAEVALSAMRDGGLVATLHDLADRRSEEDALRATAAGYRDLVEGVEDWIWTADRSGIVTFSNRAGEAVIGHRPARLIGHPLLDVVSPDARDEEARRLQDAAAAKQGWSVTVRRLHADGTERTLDSRASPILDAAGELLGWRGIERPAATAAPAPAPLQAAAPEPGPAEPAAPEAAPEGPAPREPGPWVRPAAEPAADEAAPIAPAPPEPGPSVPAAADPAAEELAPVEPAHVEPVPREAAPVDVVSEAAAVDVVSEAAPVDVVSEAAPVEAVTEEAAAADAATEEAAPLEPPAAHEQAPAEPAAAGAPSDVSDPAAWETARAYLARAGVGAPAGPEPELGPPLTAPAVRQPTPGGGDVAIVRQPIADAEGTVVGYELLVGGGALGPRPLGEAGTTAAMLLDIFGDVGLDRLSGRHPAWVTITPAFLLEVGTPPVRPDRVVLQIAATPVPAEALAALQRLRWSGYTVALTGYDGRAELVELLDVAGIVKVTVAGRSDQELRAATAEPSKRNLKLIATRVETPEEVER